jgi:diguanylate cyclase (GGDEF)-like protein/PAS domain S-box-containing protein
MRGEALRRRGRLTVLAVATALFVVSVGIALHRAVEQYRLETLTQRASVWTSSQALVELHRLRSALHALEAAPDREAARLAMLDRFEILLSRLGLLAPGNEETTDATQRQLDVALGLLGLFEMLEPDLVAYDPADAGLARRVGAALDHAEELLAGLNLALHLERTDTVGAARENASRLGVVFAGAIVGVLLSLGLLSLLLRRGMRRAQETERTLRVLVDALPVAVTAVDGEGRFVLANGAARRLYRLGTSEEAVLGQPAARLGAAPWIASDAAAVIASRAPQVSEEREVMGEDGPRSLIASAAPVLSAGDKVLRVVSVGLDVTERRRADARIRHLAEHDALTGLPNRLLFAEQLRAALGALPEGRMVAIHCLDLDDFKGVNDSLGHPIGDALLVAAAARMRGALRAGDTLARLGGDEFAVIQRDIAAPREATEVAARLVAALDGPFRIEGYTLRSSTSVGTALAPQHGTTAEALLQRADIALYRAKAAGRHRAELFSAEQEARLIERRRMEEDLHQALAEGQFSLAYQPKFRLADGALVGAEALLRWRHPERGWVPPGLFIPLAEESGLIHPITRFVLDTACRQTVAWRAEGLEIPVAVNLSAAEFRSGQAVRLLREALEAAGGDPALIEVEVTEGVFLRNAKAAADAVAELHALGVSVALDDFGTGYSSLGYLQHLPFDVIKIDKQFVDRVAEPGPSRHIVDAVVRLAHGLSARVVAEGVETRAQAEALAALDCDDAQGFLLSRPLAPEALAEQARAGLPPLAAAA